MAVPLTRLAYRVPEAAQVIGVGRSKFYELVKDGKIATVKRDGITLVTTRELERYLSLEDMQNVAYYTACLARR